MAGFQLSINGRFWVSTEALIAHDPALRLKRNSAWNDAIWWARFQRCEEVLRLIGE
jgi:hypothetical protein